MKKSIDFLGVSISLIWNIFFFLLIIPWLVLEIGEGLDWLVWHYFINPEFSWSLDFLVWFLRFLGIIFIVVGFWFFARAWGDLHGKGNWFPFGNGAKTDERKNGLVTHGVYQFVRHPMVLGYLLFLEGLAWWKPSAMTALWVVPLIGAVVVETATDTEEKELFALFGEEFRQYCRDVPSVFPNWKVIRDFKTRLGLE